jgi:hypothetical protein
MNSRHDSLSGMGRRAGKANLMLWARDRQRDDEDDLGSDHEVNLSWQGRFPFTHFQSGPGISNLLSQSPQVCPLLRPASASLLVLALAGDIPGDLTHVSKYLAARVPPVNYKFWSQACNSMIKQTLKAPAKSVSQYTKLTHPKNISQ